MYACVCVGVSCLIVRYTMRKLFQSILLLAMRTSKHIHSPTWDNTNVQTHA